MGATVAIAQDEREVGNAIDRVLDEMPLERIVRDAVVAIKPNETWADGSDTTAVTQPEVLRAVIRRVKRERPSYVVVTGGAGAAETGDVLRASGMMAVIEEEGVEFVDHNAPPFVEVPLEYGDDDEVEGPQRAVVVNERVPGYERLIVLSNLKVHEVATVTLALKNIAMSFPAADHYGHPRHERVRENCFFDDMHSFIAAMAKRFPIDLAITVAHPGMVGQGPIGGKPVWCGLALASEDALAADIVGARVLGFGVQGVRHLWEGARLGLGTSDIGEMRFPLMSVEDALEAFSRAAYAHAISPGHA